MSNDNRSTKEKLDDMLENEYHNYRHWDGMFYSLIKQMEKGKVLSIDDIKQLKDSMLKKQEIYCKKLNSIRPEIEDQFRDTVLKIDNKKVRV